MRKKKGNLLQRTMALLLSVVLAAGMALDAYPLTALAQENAGGGYNAAEESVIGNTVTEEATEQESEEKDNVPGSGEKDSVPESGEKDNIPESEEKDSVPESGEKDNVPESGEDTQESDGEESAADSEAEITGDTEESEETEKPVENPAAAEEDGVSEQAGDDIASGTDWTIDKDGKLTIQSDAGMADWVNDENYDDNNQKIETVELLTGVTRITSNAFSESSLADITIPSSVIAIETQAFSYSDLTNITIPESVTSIGGRAFARCGRLESVTVLGETPATIDEKVFEYCKFEGEGKRGIEVPEGFADAWLCGRKSFQVKGAG